jgi:hypothetical protein
LASLQARSALRSTHPLLIFYKLISVVASVLLLAAGWLTLCFLKAELAKRDSGRQSGAAGAAQAGAVPSIRVSEAQPARTKRLSRPVKLVYSCADDQGFFHTSKHLPAQCDRSAMSEEAAIERNLKPCGVCIVE